MSSELHLSYNKKIVCECSITLHENMHIGVGDKSSPLGIITDSSGNPIIPGSSLKGFFRAYVNRILNGVHVNGGTIDGIDLNKLDDEKILENFEKKSSEDKIKTISEGKLSAISLLFGVSGFASPIKFTDAVVFIRNVVAVGVRAHARLDIDKESVQNLITMESVQPYAENKHFIFKIVFEELSDRSMREANLLFYYLLRMLTKGIEGFVGGWRSRGYGFASIKCEKIIVQNSVDLLVGNNPIEYSGESLTQYVNDMIRKFKGEQK
ncbi:MAG: RAMP superfamily CRISPR-associated protein [Brevinematia bacterium]